MAKSAGFQTTVRMARLVAFVLVTASAHATDHTWTGASTANAAWGTAANWDALPSVWDASVNVFFYAPGAARLYNVTSFDRTIGSLTFTSTAASPVTIKFSNPNGAQKKLTIGSATVPGSITMEDPGVAVTHKIGESNNDYGLILPNELTVTVNGAADRVVKLTDRIMGEGGIKKEGTGALLIANAYNDNNTYSGGTTINGGTMKVTTSNGCLGPGDVVVNNGGTLSLSISNAIADKAALTVAAGGMLNLNYAGENTVLFLNLGGSPAAAGTWGSTSSAADNTNDTYFSGAGVINNLNGLLVNQYLWEGGTTNIVGDGDASSAGGSGTWNSSTQNWDKGYTAHAPWGNTVADKAVFAGTAGTVTLDEVLNIRELEVNAKNTFTGNALVFPSGGSGSIAVNLSGATDEEVFEISSAISNSPSVYLGIGAGSVNYEFVFAPTAGTVALGTVSGGGLIQLGGSTTGNTIAAVTGNNMIRVTGGEWALLGDARAYRHWVNYGTLIVNAGGKLSTWNSSGINLSSNATLVANGTVESSGVFFTGSAQGPSPWNVARPGGTLKGTGVVKSGSQLNVRPEATLAPGYPTGTLTLTNCDCTINGTLAITVNGNKVSTLALNTTKTLTITSATLDINVTGLPSGDLVIATYGAGKLVGPTFASSNLPRGWTIDYSYNDGTAIALIPSKIGAVLIVR